MKIDNIFPDRVSNFINIKYSMRTTILYQIITKYFLKFQITLLLALSC